MRVLYPVELWARLSHLLQKHSIKTEPIHNLGNVASHQQCLFASLGEIA